MTTAATRYRAPGGINSDGFADLIIGAPYADPNCYNYGASYVIFGHRVLDAIIRIGTEIGQIINGGLCHDMISGLGCNDTLFGWKGRDTILGSDGRDTPTHRNGDKNRVPHFGLTAMLMGPAPAP